MKADGAIYYDSAVIIVCKLLGLIESGSMEVRILVACLECVRAVERRGMLMRVVTDASELY